MKFHGQENKKAHSKHVIVQQTDKDRRSGPVFLRYRTFCWRF
jgi:hypothetical protein